MAILFRFDSKRLRFSIIIRRGQEQNRPRLLLSRIESVQNRSHSESKQFRIESEQNRPHLLLSRIEAVQNRIGSKSKRFRIESVQNPKRNGIESIPLRFDLYCTASILNRLDLCDGFDSERSKLGGCRFFPASILNQVRDDLCVCTRISIRVWPAGARSLGKL